MKPSDLIKAKIEIAEVEITPLVKNLERLRKEHGSALAKEFIAANNITRSDVELSEGEGKPWFGTVWKFAEWLSNHSTKNYADWNGVIYRQSDLKAGRMPEMPATINDLPCPPPPSK